MTELNRSDLVSLLEPIRTFLSIIVNFNMHVNPANYCVVCLLSTKTSAMR